MLEGSVLSGVRAVAELLLLQFATPFLLLVPVGLYLLGRDWRQLEATAGLLVMLVLNTVFFAFYDTWDRFAFLLPSFVILVFAGSYGVEHLRRMAPHGNSRSRPRR